MNLTQKSEQMQKLLDQLSKVVDQVQNHHCNHRCCKQGFTAEKTIVCNLITLAREHRRQFHILPADPAFYKSFKHFIKLYQSILISTLDTLYEIQLSCKEKALGEACLIKQSINKFIDLLCFLQTHFPNLFDDRLKVPLPTCAIHRQKIKQPVQMLRERLEHKKVNKSLQSVGLHPFIDFLESHKEKYTFCDLAFMNSWLAVLSGVCNKPQINKEFEKLLYTVIIRHDLNSQECMDYFSEFFSKIVNLQENVAEQLMVLKIFLKEIEKVQVTNPVGYNPNVKTIRFILAKWLNAEIGFIQNSCHRNEQHQLNGEGSNCSIDKLKLKKPVPEISLFIKGLVENNVIEASTQTEIFRFVSHHFSSVNEVVISENSLSKKYYSPSDRAIKGCKNTIIALLNWIQMQEPKTF